MWPEPRVQVIVTSRLWRAVTSLAKCKHSRTVEYRGVIWCKHCGALAIQGDREWTPPDHVYTIQSLVDETKG